MREKKIERTERGRKKEREIENIPKEKREREIQRERKENRETGRKLF